jgi:pyroglutamyl-peptidase
VASVLPVTFADAAATLLALVDEHRPRLVVATGLAEGRDAVTPERVAVNLADALIPDNAGAQPWDEPVVSSGPAAYFSTLPVKAIGAALAEAGHPVALSHSAGTFVCNHVFYALLHHLEAGDGPPAGFVHLPAAAVLPVDAQADALRVVVRTALDVPRDVPLVGGALA